MVHLDVRLMGKVLLRDMRLLLGVGVSRLGSHLRSLLRLLMHLGLGLSLCLSCCLIKCLFLFEEVALAVGALHAGQVIQIDHLFEVLVAGVAVVGAKSAANRVV